MEAIAAPEHVPGAMAEYQPGEGAFDELKTPQGEIRPHWAVFQSILEGLGPAETRRRWEQARHMVRDNRVCYNLSVEGRARTRVWPLDPFPLLLDAAEWEKLAAGLSQRARLLNAVLADWYGSQQTLQRRLVPPEVFFAGEGLLRACHGLP
ncbi:MAG TPA: circularly permuted type 2 ATP-grasp protein, partial [Candidatus Xenobia bacterium]